MLVGTMIIRDWPFRISGDKWLIIELSGDQSLLVGTMVSRDWSFGINGDKRLVSEPRVISDLHAGGESTEPILSTRITSHFNVSWRAVSSARQLLSH